MRVLAFISALWASPLAAHEFWISPVDAQVPPGAPLVADIRVGENFVGNAFSYVERNTTRYDLIWQGETVDPEATLGDRPILNRVLPGEGLAIMVYESSNSGLTYDNWQKFVDFVEHKDLRGALERHAARGLPQTGFRETYRRYAKSLMAVGNGAGSDEVVGLATEIVALANPYDPELGETLPVKVLLRGEPRVDVQVEIYERNAAGDVSVSTARTDGEGVALIAVKPGHDYMLDSVYLTERRNRTAWHSMWANLTFSVPG
ncbi:MAG: DUF4198 domain-containing protein [Pseudomonadota bacterium]